MFCVESLRLQHCRCRPVKQLIADTCRDLIKSKKIFQEIESFPPPCGSIRVPLPDRRSECLRHFPLNRDRNHIFSRFGQDPYIILRCSFASGQWNLMLRNSDKGGQCRENHRQGPCRFHEENRQPLPRSRRWIVPNLSSIASQARRGAAASLQRHELGCRSVSSLSQLSLWCTNRLFCIVNLSSCHNLRWTGCHPMERDVAWCAATGMSPGFLFQPGYRMPKYHLEPSVSCLTYFHIRVLEDW